MDNFFKVASIILGITVILLLNANHSLKQQYREQLELAYWDRSVIDSLHSELYIKELELSSYLQQLTILDEVDPVLAESIRSQVEF